jgi:hypothetical protein
VEPRNRLSRRHFRYYVLLFYLFYLKIIKGREGDGGVGGGRSLRISPRAVLEVDQVEQPNI